MSRQTTSFISPSSTSSFSKRFSYTCLMPFSFANYPKNLFLLPVFLLLHHLVAIVELVSAICVNSLGLFAHGAHMVFNGILLTGLITSILCNWYRTKRYSLCYVRLVVKSNFLLGCVFLSGGLVLGYMSVRHAIEPPAITYESLFYLIPVPAFLLDLVGVYVILHGNDAEEELEVHMDATTEEILKKVDMIDKKSSESICHHMLANACGSVGTIICTVLVQTLGWIAADTACAMFSSVIMLASAMYLIKESIDMTLDMLRQPNVFTVSYYIKSEIHQLSNIFTV